MRRKTRPKVVWAPGTNANSVGTLNEGIPQFGNFTVPVGPDGVGVFEIPLIQDGVQNDPLGASSSLADIESTGYRLRRICGKVWVFAAQEAVNDGFGLYCVTAGLIVRRTNPQTGGSMAAALSGTTPELIDPTNIESSGDPWIWRRSWLLANDGATPPTTVGINASPHQNFGAAYPGGISEGPHLDQKTARVIGPEERLFLDVSARTVLDAVNFGTTFLVVTDLRVLISMRQSVGNRRNASR